MVKAELKESVLKKLSEASLYGNLGLFIGAGFTKAICEEELFQTHKGVLSWRELLEKVCYHYELDFDDLFNRNYSYPQLASQIAEKLSKKNSSSIETAITDIKNYIAELVNWYPPTDRVEVYREFFHKINPAWIITTNYDLVLEIILAEKGRTINPYEPLITKKGIIPIYHIHGTRINPSEIIITQEDYVKLFRPNEYRMNKLTLLLSESTTLFLGYSLGDVNVLTALDWSSKVYEFERDKNFPSLKAQVIISKQPTDTSYLKNEISILEYNNLDTFFQELVKMVKGDAKYEEELNNTLNDNFEMLQDADEYYIRMYVEDKNQQISYVETVIKYSDKLLNIYILFLNKCFSYLWEKTEPNGAFDAYDDLLKFILNHLGVKSIKEYPISLTLYFFTELARVSRFVGGGKGESWPAEKTWYARKQKLGKDLIKELRIYADQNSRYELKKLLK